jgi:hypothetical protein
MYSTQVYFNKKIFIASMNNMVVFFDNNSKPLNHPLAGKKIITNDN